MAMTDKENWEKSSDRLVALFEKLAPRDQKLTKRATEGGKILPSRRTALVSLNCRIVVGHLSGWVGPGGLTRYLGSLPVG
jgi:hypothetical protein